MPRDSTKFIGDIVEANLRLTKRQREPRIIYGLASDEITERETTDFGQGIEVLVAKLDMGALVLEWGCFCMFLQNAGMPGLERYQPLVTQYFDAREEAPDTYECMVIPPPAMRRLLYYAMGEDDPYLREKVKVPAIEEWQAC